MRALTASELLNVWERGGARAPVDRALDLLTLACPESSREQLAQLPIGERDARLLALRETLFGARLTAVTACPNCRDNLELTFDHAQFNLAPMVARAEETFALTDGNWRVLFRLPNSADVLAIARTTDERAARRMLFERCAQETLCDGAPRLASQVPDAVMNAVAAQMMVSDPQADLRIALACPACAHEWSAVFDIVFFLWTEITAWATRLLREVHQLASAYGWREADIVALSPRRRQSYLELIG